VGGLNVNQALMAITAVAAGIILFLRHRNSNELLNATVPNETSGETTENETIQKDA
jgi:hypothetical protein